MSQLGVFSSRAPLMSQTFRSTRYNDSSFRLGGGSNSNMVGTYMNCSFEHVSLYMSVIAGTFVDCFFDGCNFTSCKFNDKCRFVNCVFDWCSFNNPEVQSSARFIRSKLYHCKMRASNVNPMGGSFKMIESAVYTDNVQEPYGFSAIPAAIKVEYLHGSEITHLERHYFMNAVRPALISDRPKAVEGMIDPAVLPATSHWRSPQHRVPATNRRDVDDANNGRTIAPYWSRGVYGYGESAVLECATPIKINDEKKS